MEDEKQLTDLLTEIFYDETSPAFLSSSEKTLMQELQKKTSSSPPYKVVRNFLNDLNERSAFKPVRWIYPHSKTFAHSAYHQIQADSQYYRPPDTKTFYFLLNVVDVFSFRIHAVPVANLKATTVSQALATLLDGLPVMPKMSAFKSCFSLLAAFFQHEY